MAYLNSICNCHLLFAGFFRFPVVGNNSPYIGALSQVGVYLKFKKFLEFSLKRNLDRQHVSDENKPKASESVAFTSAGAADLRYRFV